MGVSGLAVRDTGLIGRDSEVSLLRGLVDPPSGESRVLVLLGDAGMGKTALLADAARQARSTGMWVLSVTGREPEQYLAFAGLRQLLLPVLDRMADLPDRQVTQPRRRPRWKMSPGLVSPSLTCMFRESSQEA